MKGLRRFMRESIDMWDILAVLFFSVFTRFWLEDYECVIEGILGGISTEYGNELELFAMGKWMFLFAFYFFIICRKLSRNRRVLTFTLSRCKSFKEWWNHQFITIHGINFMIFAMNCVIWKVFEAADGKNSSDGMAIIVTFFLHLSVWVSILTLCDVVFESKIVPCIMLVAEGMLYVCSVSFDAPWIACGMYARCSYARVGIIAVIIVVIKALVLAACYLAVPKLWKCGYLEREVTGWKAL